MKSIQEMESTKHHIKEKKDEISGATNENKSLYNKFCTALSGITVEPLMLLFIAPSVMGSLATENLNLEKACRVNIGYDQNVCDAMVLRNTSGYSAHEEIEVQKLVSRLLGYKTAIQGAVPFLLMIFLGSWSDRHGKRKPFILMPIFGETVSCIGYIICTYFFMELSVEYAIFFEAIPPSVTGGWFCFFVGVYSYVGANSTLETKTEKVGSAAMLSYSSVTIGIALSGVMLRLFGFYGVYGLSIFFFIVAIVYGFITLKDDRRTEETDPKKVDEKKSFLADLFDLKHISNTVSICFKEGPNNRKYKICGVMVLVLIIVGPNRGEYNVLYMFTRRKFAWDELSYSAFNTFHWVVQLIGSLICLSVFVKCMKVDDATLGMIAMASKIAASVAYGLAPTSLLFYIAAIFELFNATSHIAMRSILSKLVPPDELGQTNSLFGMCEALTPLLCGPLYSFVYNATIAYFPGTFFFISALAHAAAFLIFLWIYSMNMKDKNDVEKNKEKNETSGYISQNIELTSNNISLDITQSHTRLNEEKKQGTNGIEITQVTEIVEDAKGKEEHTNKGYIPD